MKKNKSNIVTLLIASLLLLGLNSCVLDSSFGLPDEEQEVNLTLNTRLNEAIIDDGTSNENSIVLLRAIVFEVSGTGNNLTFIRQIKNQTFMGNPSRIQISFKRCDNVRVLLIANEKEEWNLASQDKTESQIRNFQVTYGSWKEAVNIKTPIVMFGESATLSGQHDNNTTIQLIRNLARVDVNISCAFSDIAELSNGGILTLENARIERMAPTVGLGEPMSGLNLDDNFLTGTQLAFTEINYKVMVDKQGRPTGFTTLGNGDKNSITFYVPEYYIENVKAYSYIYITGKFYPGNSIEAVNVAYTIPLGAGITTGKINSGQFDIADLIIERNNLYEIKAIIKSIQQINEINVDVKAWTEENVNGSIQKPESAKLNVSDLYPTLDVNGQNVTLVHFWSDQERTHIRVLPQGKLKDTGVSFNTNDLFFNLADTEGSLSRPTNLQFEGSTQWGRLVLLFRPGQAIAGKTYVITLVAGTLQRTIEVTAIN